VLPAGSGQPPILAREAWALGLCRPRVAPEYGSVEVAFVHHTENPNGYLPAEVPAMLRAIFAFHRDGRGWNDIGYNFILDRFGRIFEARAGGIDEPVTGAQAGGYNYRSTGIGVLGEYGARQISTGVPRALAGGLAFLDGSPIAGAPIAVQARSVRRRGQLVRERTIGQAVTDAEGKWSLPLPVGVSPSGSAARGGRWLRALCPGASGVPATVSDPVHVAGAVAVSPQPTPAPVPTPPATPSPAP
jgi:hypothetical protein